MCASSMSTRTRSAGSGNGPGRARIAELVEKLDAAGAKAIGFDVIFAEPVRNSPQQVLARWGDNETLRSVAELLPDDDTEFAKALRDRPTVLGFALSRTPTPLATPSAKVPIAAKGEDPAPFLSTYRGAVPPLPDLLSSAGLGALNFDTASGGIIRYVPLAVRLDDQLYPSISIELARLLGDNNRLLLRSAGAEAADSFARTTGIAGMDVGGRRVQTDAEGNLWLHFTPPGHARYVSAWKVLAGDALPADALRDTIAILGSSATSLQDVRFTPFGLTPGVELHAQAVEQILADDYLTRPDWVRGAEALFLVLLWLALVPLIMRLGTFWSAMVALGVLACALAASWLAFVEARLLIDPLMPTLTAVALYVGCSLPRHIQTERQQRWIR